jgi:lauroyl/myristoyl acyltransferase
VGRSSTVRVNLRACDIGASASRADVNRMARDFHAFACIRNTSRMMPYVRGFQDSARWPVTGREHLADALSSGRGAILATAHFGYSALIAPILRLHGYEITEVAGRKSAARVERAEGDAIRVALNVRPLFRALARNRILFVPGDGMRAMGFVTVSFLGTRFPFPTGFMKIAAAAQAPLLPVFAVDTEARGSVAVEIQPALSIDPGAPVAENVQRYARVLEEQIRARPHMWNRWRIPGLFDTALAWTSSDVHQRYAGSWKQSVAS